MSSTAESKIPVIAVCWGLVAFLCAFAVYWVPPPTPRVEYGFRHVECCSPGQ